MTEVLFNTISKLSVDSFLAKPSHAVMLIGPRGVGKLYVAKYMAASLLDIDKDKLDAYPHLKQISPEKNTISIEQIREVQKLLTLKVPGVQYVRRIVIIENAQAMTVEAQNALLKSLEEPPRDTVIVLTATESRSLLPTVTSRAQSISILPVSKTQLGSMSTNESNLAISGGLPGLLHALEQDEQNALIEEIIKAKSFLSKTAFERMTMTSEFKEREEVSLFLDALLVICSAGLKAAALKKQLTPTKAWQRRVRQIYMSQKQLSQNASLKLLITDLALGL